MAKQFIDALGGTGAVADTLGLSPSVVSNWKARGIPWRYRTALARQASERGVDLPKGYWDHNS